MKVVNHMPEAVYTVRNSKEAAGADLGALLEKYNAKLVGQGTSSRDSFPIGNGDITANVWTAEDALHFYIGKSDAWSEALRLLKVGGVTAKFSPSPFADGADCVQVLHLQEGILEVVAGQTGQQVRIRMWVDANHPVIRTEVTGDYDFNMEVTAMHWRDHEVSMTQETRHSFYGLSENPNLIPKESADRFLKMQDCIVWCHYNEYSYFKEILKNQRMEEMQDQDPYLGRCFGAAIEGNDFIKAGENLLMTACSGRCFSFSVHPYTCQCATVGEWQDGLEKQILKTCRVDRTSGLDAHRDWWQQFWNRSYIFIEGDEAAETVTRGYLMQRYMQAIQGRGNYPMKFNGGTLTFDYEEFNADYRQWGPAYWFQNNRLQYWNMLASGDFEMMLPFFKMYRDMLPMQKAVTKKYFGHEGAFFPETVYFTGLYTPDNFGWNNEGTVTENCYIRYYWQSGLELSRMMLDYFAYTEDTAFVKEYLLPIACEVVRFYDLHYGHEDGKLVIEPAHSLETYWDEVKDPVEVVAGLRSVLTGLLELPGALTGEEDRSSWARLLAELPEITVSAQENGDCISPAGHFSPTRYNMENPELYPVFPYRLYGVGKENLTVAQNTFYARQSVFDYCWSQNGIQAALLGLTADAKKAVTSHFSNLPEDVSFPGFWSKGNDWMPDLDNGGSAMTALQKMLVQEDDGALQLFPTWPEEWKVTFKLHTADGNVINGSYLRKERV